MYSVILEEKFLKDFLIWLDEDIPYYDVTARFLPNVWCKAVILAKSDGVVAGLNFVSYALNKLGLKVERKIEEGKRFGRGDILAIIEGDSRLIVSIERVILNFLCHLCGIAYTTKQVVDKARRVNDKIRIAATRKTLPMLRLYEKYAVEIGGGDPHRFSLSDMVLIKDNHIRIYGGIENAIKVAKNSSFTKKIEVEVTNKEEAIMAAKLGADIIMLDNMKPDQIRETLRELEKLGLRRKVLIEASGGINLDNIEEYAGTGVDIISMGMLTHSIKACDISIEIVECKKMEK